MADQAVRIEMSVLKCGQRVIYSIVCQLSTLFKRLSSELGFFRSTRVSKTVAVLRLLSDTDLKGASTDPIQVFYGKYTTYTKS